MQDWKELKIPSGAREVHVEVELPFTVASELATWMRVACHFEPNRQIAKSPVANTHSNIAKIILVALREDKLWIISIRLNRVPSCFWFKGVRMSRYSMIVALLKILCGFEFQAARFRNKDVRVMWNEAADPIFTRASTNALTFVSIDPAWQ
jgi:hypothetical protein